jgi:hypothetical protein
MSGFFALLVAIGVALSVAILPAAALAASPPKVQIEPAEQTPTGFVLKATVNPEGSATSYYFIYKQAGAVECEDLEGCGPETPHGGPLTGGTQQQVQAEVTGLEPNTAYVYWLIARNANPEAVRSRELTFTTPPTRTPPSELVTGPAEATPSGYNLNGKLNPDGLPTTYYYEYIGSNEMQCLNIEPGLDRCWHETPHAGPITGNTQQQVPPIEVTGLTAGATYHYRLVATNADRTVFGKEASFTVGPSPVVDSVSLFHLTSSDATLEAQIDTEGLSTMYEFRMTYTRCRECEDIVYQIHLPSGLLLGSFQDQSVSVDLNSVGVTLKPGFYEYSLIATSTGGSTEAPGGSFEPPPGMLDPPGPGASPLSAAGQPGVSNGSDQPTGSAASSSPSTPGVQSPDVLGTKTTKLEALTSSRKLVKALKVCAKKPKQQRASCRAQAHKRYGTSGKQASTRKK